jgi:NAD(P)-dependent dehydrogenase (short-subunit alcohol dehydrogenase family)
LKSRASIRQFLTKMSTSSQVAIITGGASGIGLAVAEALAARGDWIIHTLDKNKTGDSNKLKASFHQVDVTDYNSLASAFSAVFSNHKRLDFVFANAGVALEPAIATENGLETNDKPPPAPGTLILDINLRSVIYTTYLASHYFKLCAPPSSVRSLVITASSAGFYASPISPVYAASKHGVVGWTRSIAPTMWKEAGVRVNAICPGIVRTRILPDEMFQVRSSIGGI